MLKKGTLASPATALARRVLPVPGAPDEQDAFGNPPAQPLEFLRGLQELHDFLKLFLGLVDAGDVGKGDFRLVLREEFGLALG